MAFNGKVCVTNILIEHYVMTDH